VSLFSKEEERREAEIPDIANLAFSIFIDVFFLKPI